MESNPFLRDFLKMRQAISVPGPQHKAAGGAEPAKKKKEPKPLAALAEPEGISIAKIIEDKPKRKVLIEFLQTRANALTKEKMK